MRARKRFHFMRARSCHCSCEHLSNVYNRCLPKTTSIPLSSLVILLHIRIYGFAYISLSCKYSIAAFCSATIAYRSVNIPYYCNSTVPFPFLTDLCAAHTVSPCKLITSTPRVTNIRDLDFLCLCDHHQCLSIFFNLHTW